MPQQKRRQTLPHSQALDENFECLIRVAYSIWETLARPKDRNICGKTLAQLSNFNKSNSMEVKQNVRQFLKFYLRVLRWTQTHQPIILYEKWYGKGGNKCETSPSPDDDETHIWLEEGSSYLAMKHFDDGSIMIYSAVAKDATSGWAENGFKLLSEQKD
ncbi:LOW QUALITY PROTEIN: uncharacterized protein LOC6561587 [Drosophila grimshawi]|uniref:LOW QUALITY PROTEIN: uncharacterized protein LOC6561587 n=1 Tax=Drosophila grimshawi TaxID=7222 RepID=UPI001C9339E2|nr:LOW QUALITY PROTEIN: uncharacterized protein LOC6561587 [Drosophila grimshawi]